MPVVEDAILETRKKNRKEKKRALFSLVSDIKYMVEQENINVMPLLAGLATVDSEHPVLKKLSLFLRGKTSQFEPEFN